MHHGFCHDLLAKASHEPGFKGQAKETLGKFLLGELQGYIAKGVETVKDDEFGWGQSGWDHFVICLPFPDGLPGRKVCE